MVPRTGAARWSREIPTSAERRRKAGASTGSSCQQTAAYILVCSDAETFTGFKRTASAIARARLERGVWPLYRGTQNRVRMRVGDHCLIYLAGQGPRAQHIIAAATIDGVDEWNPARGAPGGEDVATDIPGRILVFREISSGFAVPIRPLLDRLSFTCQMRRRWGSAMQGGSRLITSRDERLIRDAIGRVC